MDREQRRAYQREWNERNRERVAAYRREHADERNARRRERYAGDAKLREAACAQVRRYRERHPDRKRDARLRAQFGIGLADYERMLAEQGGGCAVCGRERGADGTRLHVDHCHRTGRVRGLLCCSCNLGLGKFGDDAERLERAAAYLRRQA